VRLKTFQTSFVSGQISTKLRARVGQQVYENGAADLTNCELMMQGGVARRAGSRVLASLPASVTDCRIEGHVFNRSEAYLFVFSPGMLRIYDANGAFVRDATGQPWGAQTIWTMSVRTFGNITFVCDQSFRPITITRRNVGSFVLSSVQFDNPHPVAKYEAHDTRLRVLSSPTPPSPYTNYLEAVGWAFDEVGAPSFANTHVSITGQLFETGALVTVSGQLRLQARRLGAEQGKFLDPNPFTTVSNRHRIVMTWYDHGFTSADENVAQFTISDSTAVGGHSNVNGTWTVELVLDEDRIAFWNPTQATSSDTAGGPAVRVRSMGPTRDWAERVFSQSRGWPQAVEFHQGRLWLAGPTKLADAVFGSRLRSLFDFDPGEGRPTDAVRAISETQNNAIRHLISTDDLLVFGDLGEAYFPSADEPLSQETVRGLPQSTIGSSFVRPIRYDGAVLFVDVMGQHVHEFIFAEQMAAYVSTPVSALCPELIRRPRQAVAYKGSERHSTPFCIWTMADGSVAVFTSRRAEGAAGWVRWETKGDFLSFATLNERLYAVVRRNLNGQDQIAIEEFCGDGCPIPDGCYELTSGDPSTSWTSPYGQGAEVDVVDADAGVYLGRATGGFAGQFEMDVAASRVLVGLPFVSRVETLPPALQLPEGMSLGERQSISQVVTHFHETSYAEIDGSVMVQRMAYDMTGDLTPFSGPIPTRQAGWLRHPTVAVECPYPVPFSVLGMMVEVVA
jgi:hypothetical protein